MDPLVTDATLIIGVVGALLTELVKVFPAINASEERKGLVAFLLALLISLLYLFSNGLFTVLGLIQVAAVSLGISFLAYKTLVKPVITPVVTKIFGG